MNKKIILIILLVILIVSSIIFLKNDSSEKSTPNTPDNAKKQTEDVISKLLDPKSTKEELVNITGSDTLEYNVIVGKDSLFRWTPKKDIVKKYSLNSYVDLVNKYSDEIDNKFLNNLDYKIISSESNENGEIVQTIEAIGFYYELYATDHSVLAIKLLEDSGYDASNVESDEKTNASFFKAKVKAMELMEPYLSEYENYGEKTTFKVVYVNGKPKDSDQMLNLTLGLRGMMYDNMNMSIKENNDAHNARIKKYIDNGYKTGIIKKGNLLD